MSDGEAASPVPGKPESKKILVRADRDALRGEYLGGLKAKRFSSFRQWSIWRRNHPTERVFGSLYPEYLARIARKEGWDEDVRQILSASSEQETRAIYAEKRKSEIQQRYADLVQVGRLQRQVIKRCKAMLASGSLEPGDILDVQKTLEGAQRVLNLQVKNPTSIVDGKPSITVVVIDEKAPYEKPGRIIEGEARTLQVATVHLGSDATVHGAGGGTQIGKDRVVVETGSNKNSPIKNSGG